MSACTGRSPHDLSRVQQISPSGEVKTDGAFRMDQASSAELPVARQSTEKRVRVYVAAHNRLLREALARILTKRGNVEVTGVDSPLACEAETLLDRRRKFCSWCLKASFKKILRRFNECTQRAGCSNSSDRLDK